MQLSKKTFFFQVLTLTFFTSLIGCSLPRPQKRADAAEQATFYVHRLDPKFTQTSVSGAFKLPASRTLSVKACVKSNARSRDLINHQFLIEGDNFKPQSVSSDASGCLIWSEELSFNFLAKSQIISLERTLTAIGSEKGSRSVNLYVNPWNEKVFAENDSKVKSAVKSTESLKALSGAGAENRSLWFDNISATLEERQYTKNGILFNLEVRGTPFLETTDDQDQTLLKPLSFGKFKVTTTLFYWDTEDNKQSRHTIVRKTDLISEGLINGNFNVQTSFERARLCSNGKVSLGLHIEPIDGPVGLKSFDGVYSVGDCDGAKGNLWMRPRTEFFDQYKKDRSYSVDQFIAVSPGKLEAENTASTQSARVEVRKLQFTTTSFDQTGGPHRKRNVNIQTCVRSGLDRRGTRWTDFTVHKLSGTKIKVHSDDEGCLNWDDSVEYDLLGQECWKGATVEISNSNLGLQQEIQVHYNPWSSDSAFRDARFVDSSVQTLICAAGKTEILLTRFDFENAEFDYALDQMLNLEVKKTGPFKLGVRIKRPSLSDPSGFSEEGAPPGLYLVRMAVVDISAEDLSKAGDQIFFATEKVMPIHGNSNISEEIELSTRNIKALGTTNQLYLEVLPLKQNAQNLLKTKPETSIDDLIENSKNLNVVTYRAPLTMANNAEGANLTRYQEGEHSVVKNLLDQFKVSQTQRLTQQAAKASPQFFARDNRLTLISAANENSNRGFRAAMTRPWAFGEPGLFPTTQSEMTNLELQHLLNGQINEKTQSQLCGYWFQDFWLRTIPGKTHGIAKNGDLDRNRLKLLTMDCLRRQRQNPGSVFDIETKIFPRSARIKAKHSAEGYFRDYSINQSFSLSRSSTESFTKTWAWDISAGLRMPEILGLSLLSASSGLRFQVSKSSADSSSQSNSVSYADGVGLNIETLKIPIVAEDYEQCLVIKLNPGLFASLKNEPSAFSLALHPQLSVQERIHYARSGLMICDGKLRGQKLEIDENFYVLNQKLAAGQILQNTSARNRPFFAALRGESDLVRLMSYLHGESQIPTSFKAEFQNQNLMAEPLGQVFLKGTDSAVGVLTRPVRLPLLKQ